MPTSETVSVIASFDSEGHIKPVYVRIGENSLKIRSAWLKPSFPGFFEFGCEVIDGDYIKPLTLSFHPSECIWRIPAVKPV